MKANNLGNKETMAKNIRYYMRLNNINQTEICSTLGFKMPTFSDWVNAKTYPRIDKIELMANYFGIEKADLVEKRSTRNKRIGAKIPVLGRVAAGIPIEAIEEIISEEEIPESMANKGKFFGLQIRGDSMAPRILEGDIVIVKQQEDAESRDLVIALIDGSDATCKRLMKYEEGIRLIPDNPAYEPMYYTNEDIKKLPVKIIGRVVENRQKY